MGYLLGFSNFDLSFATPLLYGRSVVGVCPPASEIPLVKHLPDSKDCKIYYKCLKGKPYVRPCAPGTYFNVVLEVCDELKYVDCVGKST